jgi:hypothetical protein
MTDHYPAEARALEPAEIEAFIRDGFVRLDKAFPKDVAAEGRDIMWRDIPFDRNDPTTWTQPVVRLPGYGGGPFETAVNMPVLHRAFDQLVGKGRWLPRKGLGSFPIRFPHPDSAGDDGWHVDLSFPGPSSNPDEQHNFSNWRANYTSRDRALLMLFLFSDVGENDAPTRIRPGSHMEMARLLEPAGEAGMGPMMLEAIGADCEEALATGEAGTVYLCHPLLIHAAQKHHGTEPRFMAQPPLGLAEQYRLEREDGDYSPVEIALRMALGRE